MHAGADAGRAHRPGLRRLGLLAVPVVGLALAYSGPLGGEVLYARDLLHYNDPHERMVADALRAGELPLWNPYLYCGVPLAGQGDGGTFYPPKLLFLLGDAARVLPWYELLHHGVALLGALLLLRRLGRSREAAVVGAAGFALSGTFVANHMNPRLLVGMAWIPVALALFEGAARARTRRAVACGVAGAGCALGLMILGSGLEAAYLTGLALGLRAAGQGLRAWRSGERGVALARRCGRAGGVVALTGAIGLGVAAVQLAPLLETIGTTSRATETAWQAGAWAFHPARLLTVVAPGVLGEAAPVCNFAPALLTPPELEPWHTTVYAGAALVALALAGAGRAWRRAPGLVVFGLLSLALATGDLSPAGPIARALLPGLGMFRWAEKWLAGAALVLPLVAAFGLDRLALAPRASRRRAAVVAVAGAVGVLLLGSARGAFDVAPMDLPGSARLALAGATLALGGVALAIARGRRDARAVRALVLLLVVVDLGVNAARHLYTVPADEVSSAPWAATLMAERMGGERHAARFLRRPAEGPVPSPPGLAASVPARMLHARETLLSNASQPWCEQLWGFLPGQPRRFASMWSEPRGDPQALLDLLGVRFVVVPHDGRGPDPALTTGGLLVADHPVHAVAVLERPGWKPRARLFERVVACPDDATALAALADLGRGPDVLAVVAPHLPAGPIGVGHGGQSIGPVDGEPVARAARVVEHRLGSLAVEVESARGGGLFVAEVWHPGWRATIDGQEADVLPAFGALRAVLVPAGRHRVELEYRPASLRIGAAFTAVTLLLLIAGLGLARRAA